MFDGHGVTTGNFEGMVAAECEALQNDRIAARRASWPWRTGNTLKSWHKSEE
jgi:hypothetical protein